MPKPSCQKIDPLVTPFIDGELPDPDRRAVEEHLRACPPCHSRVVAEREVHMLIREKVPALCKAEAPDTLHAKCWEIARLTPRAEPRSFDASAVARDAVRSASVDGTVVQARIADALPLVFGDPVVLRRIVDNLLHNAIESLPPEGGQVSLETLRSPGTGGGVRVIVTDTGRGMSEEELSRAFDDFHTTKAGGTGLGLSVVRRLAADLHADLRVESAPGRGTSFTIDLPSSLRSAV